MHVRRHDKLKITIKINDKYLGGQHNYCMLNTYINRCVLLDFLPVVKETENGLILGK